MVNRLSAQRGLHPNLEMSFIGFVMAALIVVLLLPLLPFVLAYVVLDWLTDRVGGEVSSRRDSTV